jgi:UDP-4-keto-D-FucNAc 4-reductase
VRDSIAITGATGFIGLHLRRALQAAGLPTVSVCRAQGRQIPGGVVVDTSDHVALARSICQSRCVIHLAGMAHRIDGRFDLASLQSANVDYALSVAKAAARCAARMIFVSSAGVLGNHSPPEGLTDDSPAQPHDAYTRSKLRAELALQSFSRDTGLKLVVVRPPVVIGPEAPGNFGRVLRYAGRWPLPVKCLHAKRSVIGARNLASFLVHLVYAEGAVGRCFLVSEPSAFSLRELVRLVAEARGFRPKEWYLPPSAIRGALVATGRRADAERLFNSFVLRQTRADQLLHWQRPYSSLDEIRWSATARAECSA